MAYKIIMCLLFLLIANYAQAQEVFVKSKDGKPIQSVTIFTPDKTKSALTNEDGRASLSSFSPSDSLVFRHPSFKTMRIAYVKLRANNFEVSLSEQVLDYREIVVSATKWEQDIEDVPNKVETISQDKIAFQNPQTSADLLEASGGVFVQKSQLGGGSPMIRGFATNSVLLVVDGVRMNNAIFRGGNLQNVINIDPNIIQGTEVIFGPGSVIYGSDALGGVMDFHTKDPRLAHNDQLNFQANAMGRHSTANQEITGHIDLNFGTEQWGFLTSFSWSGFEDLEMGSNGNPDYQRDSLVERISGRDTIIKNENKNLQIKSGYDQWNAMQKVRFKPNKHWDLQYGFHYSTTSDIPRYDRQLIRDENKGFKNAEWYYGPQKWMMNNLEVEYTKDHAWFDQARLTLARQDYEESRHDRDFGSDTIRHRVEQVDIYTANLDLDKQIDADNRLFYGFQAVHNTVHSEARKENIETNEEEPTATRYPDGSEHLTLAAHALWKHEFNDHWTLNTGARYTRVQVNADLTGNQKFYPLPFDDIELNTGAANGNVGLVFKPGKGWNLKTNISSGFRAPNIDDVGKVFDSEPGRVVVPNDDLEPEYTYNFDLGVSKNWQDRIKFEVTPFYTFVTNAMVRRPSKLGSQDSIQYDGKQSEVQALQNASSAFIYGVSASFQWAITESLKTNLKYNITEGETDEGKPIRHVAPTFGRAHLIYETERFKADFYTIYNGSIENENLAPSEQSKTHIYALNDDREPYTPSWYTLNLKVGYQLIDELKIQAGVENILDHRYRPYSSGISGPGRNFIITLRGNM